MGAGPGVIYKCVVRQWTGVVQHVSQVVLRFGAVCVFGGEIIPWEFKNDGEEGEYLGGNV